MLDVKTIEPLKANVIIRLLDISEMFENLILQMSSDEENIAMRYGEVVATGPGISAPTACPDLKVGNYVAFTQFAGYFLPTDDAENLYKMIKGYDIVAMAEGYNNENLEEVWEPTADRMMVQVIKLDDDVVLNGAKDPRLAELIFAKVVKKSKWSSLAGVGVGDTIAFDPWVGTTLREYESDDKPELRIVVDLDVLLVVKNEK